MRYSDELRDSEGERCLAGMRLATIKRVIADGEQVEVEFDDDHSKGVFTYPFIQLLDEERP